VTVIDIFGGIGEFDDAFLDYCVKHIN